MRAWSLAALAACAPGRDAPPRIAWSTPVEIAAGGGERGPWQQNSSRYDYVDDPSVALGADGAATVVWVDQQRKDVFAQVYEPSGRARFAQPVNVSRSADIFSWLPRVVRSPVEPRDVFVLWQEIVFSGGSHGGEIFFARSLDGAASFEAPLNLSRSVPGDGKARISAKVWHNGSLDLAIGDDGALYAAWTEYDGPLWFARSEDRGGRFTQPALVDAGAPKPTRAPAIAVAGDTVYLAWTVGEEDAADIRIARSADRGATFGAPVIAAVTAGYSDAPKLAVDRSGTVHLVYAESAGGPLERAHVRHARSRDGGATFEAAREISHGLRGIESAAFPALAVDGAQLVVSWELYPDAREHARGLAIASSRDGGTTFTPPERVAGSADPGGNGSHQGRLMRKLAARDGRIAIANSALQYGVRSRVWLIFGRTTP